MGSPLQINRFCSSLLSGNRAGSAIATKFQQVFTFTEDPIMSLLLLIVLFILLPVTILIAIELADRYKHPYRRRENDRTGVRSR